MVPEARRLCHPIVFLNGHGHNNPSTLSEVQQNPGPKAPDYFQDGKRSFVGATVYILDAFKREGLKKTVVSTIDLCIETHHTLN